MDVTSFFAQLMFNNKMLTSIHLHIQQLNGILLNRCLITTELGRQTTIKLQQNSYVCVLNFSTPAPTIFIMQGGASWSHPLSNHAHFCPTFKYYRGRANRHQLLLVRTTKNCRKVASLETFPSIFHKITNECRKKQDAARAVLIQRKVCQ